MDLIKNPAPNKTQSSKKPNTKNNIPDLHAAHDAFFRKMMADQQIAKDFLSQHLPEAIQKIIKFDSLEQMPDTFIQQNLKRSHCDLLYKVKLGARDGFIYTLVEHQSTVDAKMPYRIWKYIFQIMEKYKSGAQKFPLVVPIVIYNGKTKYNKPISLTSLIDADAKVTKKILGDIQPFQLIDLNKIDDEKLRNETWSGVIQYIMKHIYKQNIFQHLEKLMPNLKIIVSTNQGNLDYINTLVHYIINCSSLENNGDLSKLFRNSLTYECGEIAMAAEKTLVYRAYKEGHTEGRAEGRAEEKLKQQKEFITSLIKLNTSPEFISKVTNLSHEEIKAIMEK